MRLNKIENIIFVCFLLFILNDAFGKFYRYPISEQLGLSINFLKYGYFFPDFNGKDFYPVSPYFPGLAFLIYLLRFVIPDYLLFEFLTILGILSIFFFFFISIKISKKIYKKIPEYNICWLIIILLCLWPCRFWLYYAITFKTDTLSFGLIFFAIYILEINRKNYRINFLQVLISFILILYSISLKQQAIFVVFALGLFSLLNKDYFLRIFSFIMILSIGLFYFLMFEDKNLWFFNILRFSGDSFYTLKAIVRDNYEDITKIIFLILFLTVCNLEKLGFNNLQEKIKKTFFGFKKNIWLYIFFFLSITGIPGFLKYGGNFGNIGMSIIVLTPIIIYFLGDLKKNILTFTVMALLVLEFPTVRGSFNNYIESKKMQNKVLQLVKGVDLKILTDTESLFSSFLISDNNLLHSVDTMMILDRFVDKNQEKDFKLKTKDLEMYDFLIISNRNSSLIEVESFKLIHKSKLSRIYNKKKDES